MGVRDQLKAGMTLREVQDVLNGWREDLPSAILSPDKTHLYYTLNFRPPKTSNETDVRMTFDNGKLLFWGDPADTGPSSSSQSA